MWQTLTSFAIWGPGGGGGASIIRLAHLGSHLASLLY